MRVKRGTVKHQRYKKLRKQVKGMQHSRRSSNRLAKQAMLKALSNAYRDRRRRKRDFRQLWITRISAAAEQNGQSYSRLMGSIKKAQITLDRKVLSELAVNHPEAFKAVVETAGKSSK